MSMPHSFRPMTNVIRHSIVFAPSEHEHNGAKDDPSPSKFLPPSQPNILLSGTPHCDALLHLTPPVLTIKGYPLDHNIHVTSLRKEAIEPERRR